MLLPSTVLSFFMVTLLACLPVTYLSRLPLQGRRPSRFLLGQLRSLARPGGGEGYALPSTVLVTTMSSSCLASRHLSSSPPSKLGGGYLGSSSASCEE